MKAFTIATGEYGDLARITAACFEWSTGIVPTIISEIQDVGLGKENVYAQKLQLPDEVPYVYFDADLLFLKQWKPSCSDGTFAACLLEFRDRGIREIIKNYGVIHQKMLNGGLFIASKTHRPVMARALAHMSCSLVKSWAHEETWLNVALQELGTPILELPRNLNVQRVLSASSTGLHFCSQRGPTAKLIAVRWFLEHHAPKELSSFLLERRTFGTDNRFTGVAAIDGTDFRNARHDSLTKGMRTHRAARRMR